MKTRSVPTIPGVPTPSFASRLDTYEVERLHVKFWSLVEMVHVGYRSQRCYPVFRPRPQLQCRTIPEGILPLKEIGGRSHEAAMERFFAAHADSGVAVWADGYAHYGTFAGVYSAEFRSWVDSNLVFGPVMLVSEDKDVALIADRDLRFTVIIAPPHIVEHLDECFGGRDALQMDFLDFVKRGDFGEGPEDLDWALRELAT